MFKSWIDDYLTKPFIFEELLLRIQALNKRSFTLKSNILKDGEIIKWIWWGSCLAATIIYRALLDAWLTVKSQKSHNIYYENIYWILTVYK